MCGISGLSTWFLEKDFVHLVPSLDKLGNAYLILLLEKGGQKDTFADASYRLVIDKVKSGTRPGLEGGRRSPESEILK